MKHTMHAVPVGQAAVAVMLSGGRRRRHAFNHAVVAAIQLQLACRQTKCGFKTGWCRAAGGFASMHRLQGQGTEVNRARTRRRQSELRQVPNTGKLELPFTGLDRHQARSRMLSGLHCASKLHHPVM